jgi:hypothetical protein
MKKFLYKLFGVHVHDFEKNPQISKQRKKNGCIVFPERTGYTMTCKECGHTETLWVK